MALHDPVQAQLEAYNAHDINTFMACYAPDAVIRHGDGRVLMSGHAAIRARYERLFSEHPAVTAHVLTRLRVGNWIVDEERVRMSEDSRHVVVGYLIADGLIRCAVMMRSDL